VNEIGKSLRIKMRPSIVKKARVRAVVSDKTLGEWMEETIQEKIATGKREKQPK